VEYANKPKPDGPSPNGRKFKSVYSKTLEVCRGGKGITMNIVCLVLIVFLLNFWRVIRKERKELKEAMDWR
jgi:hypothetical protein